MQPSPFELATSLERLSDQTFSAIIPDGWQQGRGAFGGLVLGLLTRAMQAAEPDAQRTLRTLLGDLAVRSCQAKPAWMCACCVVATTSAISMRS